MVDISIPRPDFEKDRGQVGIETLVVFIAMILVAALAAGVLINTAGFLQNKASSTSHESAQQVSNQVRVIGAVGVVNVTNGDTPNEITTIELSVMQAPGSEAIDLGGATIRYIGPSGARTLVYADQNINLDASSPIYVNSTEGDLTLTQALKNDTDALAGVNVADTVDNPKLDVVSGANAYAGTFGVDGVKDGDNSAPVLNAQEDRFQINIELHDGGSAYEYNSTIQWGYLKNATAATEDPGLTSANIDVLKPLQPGAETTIRIVTMSGSQTTFIANVPQSLASAEDGEAISL